MNLSEEAKAKKREYQREWRARNRDRVREYNRRYWEAKAQEEKGKRDNE